MKKFDLVRTTILIVAILSGYDALRLLIAIAAQPRMTTRNPIQQPAPPSHSPTPSSTPQDV